jgi:hypothetical protein
VWVSTANTKVVAVTLVDSTTTGLTLTNSKSKNDPPKKCYFALDQSTIDGG